MTNQTGTIQRMTQIETADVDAQGGYRPGAIEKASFDNVYSKDEVDAAIAAALVSYQPQLFELEYYGRWTQSGGIGNPSEDYEFKNTLGVAVTSSRIGTGEYYFYFSGVGINPTNVTIQINNMGAEGSYANRVFSCGLPAANNFHLECWDPNAAALDDGFTIDIWIKAKPIA